MSIREVIAKYRVAAGAAKPPGSGWEKIPGGKDEHQGFRKKKSGGGWTYWYPSAKHATLAARHHDNQNTNHAAHTDAIQRLRRILPKGHDLQPLLKKHARLHIKARDDHWWAYQAASKIAGTWMKMLK